MKYLNIAGVIWGFFYLVFGAVKSFTLNSNDTWASVALLFALFLFPLPITIIAFWYPKHAGKALFGCIAMNVVAVSAVIVARHDYPLADMGRFIAFIVLYDLPHLFFGVGYLRAGRASGDPDSGDQRQSAGML